MKADRLMRLINMARDSRALGAGKESRGVSRDEDIMRNLLAQRYMLEDIRKRQSWIADFSSNVAGNAAYDAVLYLFSKLVKRIK